MILAALLAWAAVETHGILRILLIGYAVLALIGWGVRLGAAAVSK